MRQPTLEIPVGRLLRQWRTRRGLSQLELAGRAEISTRHLSFLENGRARPTAAMIEQLAESLTVPLRDRNVLHAAAGFAPAHRELPLSHPDMATARAALQRVLDAHEPFPALAIDRHWNLVAHNAAVPPLLAGVASELLRPPVNVVRLALDPAGLAPRIVNLPEWRAHLRARLSRQVAASGDGALEGLLAELAKVDPAFSHAEDARLFVPLVLDTPAGRLSFISTITVFGTPTEVTLAEIALETFFPADAATAAMLSRRTGVAT